MLRSLHPIRALFICIALVVGLKSGPLLAANPNAARYAILIGNSEYPSPLDLPNPVNDVLYVSSTVDIVKVEIYDLLGKQMDTKFNSGGIQSISMQSYKTGTYLVKGMGANNQQFIQKIIKQ